MENLKDVVEIYIDMDSTIVDFVKKAKEMAGYTPEDEPHNRELKKNFWKIIASKSAKGEKFFSEMDPLPDAHILWAYIQKYPHRICTATGSKIYDSKTQKREYLIKHYGFDIANNAIYVVSAENKAEHALPHRVLIDDRRKAIEPWIEAGGIGILHKSAEETIKQLKELKL